MIDWLAVTPQIPCAIVGRVSSRCLINCHGQNGKNAVPDFDFLFNTPFHDSKDCLFLHTSTAPHPHISIFSNTAISIAGLAVPNHLRKLVTTDQRCINLLTDENVVFGRIRNSSAQVISPHLISSRPSATQRRLELHCNSDMRRKV